MSITKPIVLCIFAHPDDESFGPSGTLAKFAEDGEVYIVCVTNGNDKKNGVKDIVETRKRELITSSKILGVKKVFFLDYEDGELSNNKYHEVSDKIELLIKKIRPNILLTFELRGLTGHIDHVFCSLVASYLFEKKVYIKEIYYYAFEKSIKKYLKNYFIYVPTGIKREKADLIINVEKYWDKKMSSIRSHKSQKKDADWITKHLSSKAKEEYFFVIRK